ncbi:50S ribosomal protein L10 [Candidatus Daviesbacteria bacterium]|nr:50S ribosomal protein L10 [Candidatus Daviesbacteria bacterium]
MKTRQQKQETVLKLSEKLSRAKAVVLTDYRGLTMNQLSSLRNKLREVDSEFTITKNALLARAIPIAYPLRSEASPLPPTTFQNPTATLFAYGDEILPIKALVQTLKDAGLGKLKAGLLGDQVLDEANLNQMALLPTKDELRAKIVGVLVAPLQGMVSVLQGNLRSLVYALDQLRFNQSQIKLQKGGV